MKVTSDKDNLEKKGNYDIVSVNATRKTANLASKGKYKEAMSQNLAWKNYLGTQKIVSMNASENHRHYTMQMSSFQREMRKAQNRKDSSKYRTEFQMVEFKKDNDSHNDMVSQMIYANKTKSIRSYTTTSIKMDKAFIKPLHKK